MPLTQEELQAIAKMVQGTVAEQLKATSEAVATLTKNVDVIASTMTQDKKNAEAAAAAAAVNTDKGAARKESGPQVLTLDDVKKAIGEAIGAQQQQTQAAKERDAFVGEHLGKLPAAYKAQLGGDPSKWAEEAKRIQASYEADFKAAGGKPETVGGAAKEGGKTPAQEKPDLSKLPAMERIHKGLEALPVPVAVTEGAGGEKK